MAFKVKPTKTMVPVLQKMADGYDLHTVHHSRGLTSSAFLSNKTDAMIYTRIDYVSKFKDWGWIVQVSDPMRSYAGSTYQITNKGREALVGGTR
jgi:hypothetical protein